MAPPWLAVPPKGYGGIEWVVALLADGLATPDDVRAVWDEAERTVAAAVAEAQAAPSAGRQGLGEEDVYA